MDEVPPQPNVIRKHKKILERSDKEGRKINKEAYLKNERNMSTIEEINISYKNQDNSKKSFSFIHVVIN